jgi:DNA (cytosine-5)-methyltransferase 1
MAGGIGSVNTSQYRIESSEIQKQDSNKPPYRVPLMSEILGLPWNGFTVASTFSGCGGSCTGYRMAGFKVVWANEFVPAAQASYKANAAPDSILDCRDIRLVQPEEILAATRLKPGELDIFDGSPPCQAFSTAGKREKGWGKAKTYEHGAKQCNETLFSEYLRILRGLRPKVFVAENVSGLLKGTAKGYFLEILAEMKSSGYRVSCKLLDAQWLGVPQQRQRAIFIGVREDLGINPVHPKPLAYRYSVQDAIPWIVDVRQSVFGGTDQRSAQGKPCPTVKSSGGVGAAIGSQTWVEVDTELYQCYAEEWDKLQIGEHSDRFFSLVKVDPGKPSPTVDTSAKRVSVVHPCERRKFTIAELMRICAFPDDFILCGTYAQKWERLGNSVPPVMMFKIAEAIRDKILKKRS